MFGANVYSVTQIIHVAHLWWSNSSILVVPIVERMLPQWYQPLDEPEHWIVRYNMGLLVVIIHLKVIKQMSGVINREGIEDGP